MPAVRIGLVGATGRMGQVVQSAMFNRKDLIFAAAWDKERSFSSIMDRVDVIVDFSTPDLLVNLAEACADAGKPLVTGTTGFDDDQREALVNAAGLIPVVYAPNFSVGVNIVSYLVEVAAEIMDEDWKASIHEVHHVHKKDSPSGTALRLGHLIEKHRGPDSVKYEVSREGEVVGHHTVQFKGEGERIVIEHEALDRRIFALGALRAAVWVHEQPPGLYGMGDVLGLK